MASDTPSIGTLPSLEGLEPQIQEGVSELTESEEVSSIQAGVASAQESIVEPSYDFGCELAAEEWVELRALLVHPGKKNWSRIMRFFSPLNKGLQGDSFAFEYACSHLSDWDLEHVKYSDLEQLGLSQPEQSSSPLKLFVMRLQLPSCIGRFHPTSINLKEYPNLRDLSIKGRRMVTGDGGFYDSLPHSIESLTLDISRIKEGFKGIESLPNLRKLVYRDSFFLFGSAYDVSDLAALGESPQFESLEVSIPSDADPDYLTFLTSLPRLKELSLTAPHGCNQLNLKPLKALRELRKISLYGIHSCTSLDILNNARKLRRCEIYQCRELEDISTLLYLKNLRTLTFCTKSRLQRFKKPVRKLEKRGCKVSRLYSW